MTRHDVLGHRPVEDHNEDEKASSPPTQREDAEVWQAVVQARSPRRRLSLPAPTSLVAVATLHMAQEQVNRIICELQAAVGKPYGDSALLCHWKPDSNSNDGGATGQPGQAYEITIKYRGG